MSNTFTTSKGSVLQLIKLKGKDYMPVAQRLIWLSDDVASYSTEAELTMLNSDECLAKVSLTIYNDEGRVVKKVTDFKSESKKSFSDNYEKAITGALGRCLAQAGFGTQFALQDLDEVSAGRIVDSPQVALNEVTTETTTASNDVVKKTPWKPGKKQSNDSW